MTPAEWDIFEATLSSPYCEVEMRCDGYKLQAQVLRTSKSSMTFAIQIFVDGAFKGIWCSAKEPCEEQRRFMRKVTRRLHSAKDLEPYRKAFTKRQIADLLAKTITIYSGRWNSARSLRKHLVAHNQSIELVHPRPQKLATGIDTLTTQGADAQGAASTAGSPT